ncbi:hypothetical protein KUCAC02_007759, partial [Chaenocephalus aceratus]
TPFLLMDLCSSRPQQNGGDLDMKSISGWLERYVIHTESRKGEILLHQAPDQRHPPARRPVRATQPNIPRSSAETAVEASPLLHSSRRDCPSSMTLASSGLAVVLLLCSSSLWTTICRRHSQRL